MSDNWQAEAERLRQFCRKQQEVIENLNGMADAVQVLLDIGKVFGCGHVDEPDGRRQLVNCIEQEFARVRSERDLIITQTMETFQAADAERLNDVHAADAEAEKWKAEGDMYGWNFHKGKAGGMTSASIIFYRVWRKLKEFRDAAV